MGGSMINYPCGWFDIEQLPSKKKKIDTGVPTTALPKHTDLTINK